MAGRRRQRAAETGVLEPTRRAASAARKAARAAAQAEARHRGGVKAWAAISDRSAFAATLAAISRLCPQCQHSEREALRMRLRLLRTTSALAS